MQRKKKKQDNQNQWKMELWKHADTHLLVLAAVFHRSEVFALFSLHVFPKPKVKPASDHFLEIKVKHIPQSEMWNAGTVWGFSLTDVGKLRECSSRSLPDIHSYPSSSKQASLWSQQLASQRKSAVLRATELLFFPLSFQRFPCLFTPSDTDGESDLPETLFDVGPLRHPPLAYSKIT